MSRPPVKRRPVNQTPDEDDDDAGEIARNIAENRVLNEDLEDELLWNSIL